MRSNEPEHRKQYGRQQRPSCRFPVWLQWCRQTTKPPEDCLFYWENWNNQCWMCCTNNLLQVQHLLLSPCCRLSIGDEIHACDHMWGYTEHDVFYMDAAHWRMHAVTHSHARGLSIMQTNLFQSRKNGWRGYIMQQFENRQFSSSCLSAVRVRANHRIKSSII